MDNLALQIQGVLFAHGGPMSRAELCRVLNASTEQLEHALSQLTASQTGIALVDDGSEVELRAAPAAAEAIERMRKDAFSHTIGRAGLEVLAALLYKGVLTRAEVDFLRGVNSSQTLRTLTARGLVRKTPNPKDERSFLYEPTTELLAAMSVVHPTDLPDYAEVRKKLSELEASYAHS
jgi:segregation and condensation protein B